MCAGVGTVPVLQGHQITPPILHLEHASFSVSNRISSLEPRLLSHAQQSLVLRLGSYMDITAFPIVTSDVRSLVSFDLTQ